MHEGQPLSLIDLDSTHVRLRDALWDKGYADALIADTIVVHDSARTADVTIRVNPRWVATVESVTVHGDSILSPDIVQKMITLKPGNIYKRENVIESQQALYSSNLFRRATIVLPPRGDSAKLIDINVYEARLHAVKLSAGFNTIDFIQTEGKFTNYNFFGNARRLDLHLVVSNLLAPALNGTGIFRDVLADNGLPGDSSHAYLKPTYQASIDVTQRWFGDPRNTVGMGLFSHRTSAPGIYIDKGYGTSLSFTRNVAPRTPLSLVYRYELTQVEAGDVYFCVNYGVCQQTTIGLLRNRNALSPVSLDFYMDRTNDEFNPSDGYAARADFEHASKYTLSDFRYNRVSGEATIFRAFGKAVLAGHLRGGWVRAMSSSSTTTADGLNDILHPRKRFYAGGANSVRGYGENQLGSAHPHDRSGEADQRRRLHDCEHCERNVQSGRTRLRRSLGGTHSVDPSDFTSLPTGGTSLIEGSIEYRFPFLMKNLQAAVFVDAGYVGAGSSDVTQGEGRGDAWLRRPISLSSRADSRGSRIQTVGHRQAHRDHRGRGPGRHASPRAAPGPGGVQPRGGWQRHLEAAEPLRAAPLDRAGLLMWKILKIGGITIAAIALLVVRAILGLTNTDFGRERVRRIAVSAMNKSIHGATRIGRIDGDLLRGVTLRDVSITDSAGGPFFASPLVQARYTIRNFLSKHIVINALGVDQPKVVLDKKPGAEWNFTTLFASADTTKKATTPGFGSWITLRNVRLTDGHVLVRMPWTPDDSLPKAARDSVVRETLAGSARQKVIAVPGGYQSVMEFSSLQAALPRVRIADPDSPTRVFQVASLAMTAALFNPPVADVRDLRGTIFMSTDSLWFRGLTVALPNTQLRGDGRYMLASGDLDASFHAAPLALVDLRFAYPRVPANGGGSMDLTAAMRHVGESDYNAHNIDLTVDGGTLRGPARARDGPARGRAAAARHAAGVQRRSTRARSSSSCPR